MDLLVSYQKIHSQLICCNFGDDPWSFYILHRALSLIYLFKNQFFGIVISHGFAIYHMNNTIFITKVKRPDSFKVEKFLGLSCCNAIQSHARIFFQVTTLLSVKGG